DTRGYTVAAMLEFEDRTWGVRFAEALMPRQANGIDLQWNLSRARAENIEFELRKSVVPSKTGVVRLLTYINHANMGDYRAAIQQFESGQTSRPDVTNHPLQTTTKYGFGVNVEQGIFDWLTAFGRFGWNEGRHESFAYTEVNQAITLGAVLPGKKWDWISRASRFRRMAFPGITGNISRLAGKALYLAMAVWTMAAKKSSRRFIPCIFGGAYSARLICSTSIIPDTIAIAVRCWFRRFVYTSISEELISEFTS